MRKHELSEELIKKLEGYKDHVYLDSRGIPTRGWGSTIHLDGTSVQMGEKCTREQDQDLLQYHLEKRVYPYVDKLCEGVEVPDNIYAALCSFCYNLGHGYFDRYNFKKYITSQNWGDYDPETEESTGLAEKLLRYDKAVNPKTGKLEMLQGLKNRRVAEVRFMLGV